MQKNKIYEINSTEFQVWGIDLSIVLQFYLFEGFQFSLFRCQKIKKKKKKKEKKEKSKVYSWEFS